MSGLWALQALAEAFHQWQEGAQYQQQLQQKLAACLQRWRVRGLAIAFDAFHANAVKQRKAKAVRPLCTYRWMQIALLSN